MKSLPKTAIILAIVAAVAGGGVSYYMYNKPHQNIDNAKPAFKVEAKEMHQSFEINDSAASEKFSDKIVQVSGTIDKIDSQNDTTATILLAIPNVPSGSIKCGMDPNYLERIKDYEEGKSVTIKGVFSGINKLEEMGLTMMDVELARCVVVE